MKERKRKSEMLREDGFEEEVCLLPTNPKKSPDPETSELKA